MNHLNLEDISAKRKGQKNSTNSYLLGYSHDSDSSKLVINAQETLLLLSPELRDQEEKYVQRQMSSHYVISEEWGVGGAPLGAVGSGGVSLEQEWS